MLLVRSIFSQISAFIIYSTRTEPQADTEPDAVSWVEFITRAIVVAGETKDPDPDKAAAVPEGEVVLAATAAGGDAATPTPAPPTPPTPTTPSCNFLAAMAGAPFG